MTEITAFMTEIFINKTIQTMSIYIQKSCRDLFALKTNTEHKCALQIVLSIFKTVFDKDGQFVNRQHTKK